MSNSIDGTGWPPEVHGRIIHVWPGCSPNTTALWLISNHIGRGYDASLPMKAVELFKGKLVTMYLLPNGIVTAISAIKEKP